MCKRSVIFLCWGLAVVAFTSAMAFGQGQMYDLVIAGGGDDAEEHLNAGMDVGSSDLEIPYEDSGTPATDEQLIGMRWLVPIAKDFVVGKAYIEFELKETKGSTNTAPVNVIIEGQLLPNPPGFTTAANDIANRARTKAQVKWTIPTGMAVGARFQTPDISAIIKEIVSQDGWASGNALVIILRDDKSAPSTGLRCVHSYDGNVAGAPLLHIQPPWPWAMNPDPADGAMAGTQPLLKWTPGEGAVLHNVYLGTSPELTEDSRVAANQSYAMYFHVPGFEPGGQYFWRIDEIDGTGKVNTGAVWSFRIPALKAYGPVPKNGGKYVPTDITLTWSAGSGGQLHTVYLGTSFDDVNQATGGTAELGNEYAPASPLTANTRYWWRVDESDGTTTHKGDVWSFTTMPEITITNPDLIGWWRFDEGAGNKAVDFSGHGNDGTFGGNVKWVDGFVGNAVQLSNSYVVIDGVVDEIKNTDITLSAWIKTTQTNEGNVFAANDSGSNHPVMFGIAGGNAYVNDGASTQYPPKVNDNEWHMITYVRSGVTGTIYADGTPVGTYTAAFDLSTVTRWSIGQEWDDAVASNFYIGAVDDARFYSKALTADEVKELMRGDPLLAWKPSPGHRATVDVLQAEQGVSWEPGDEAAQHDVYFGTDKGAVGAASVADTTGIYRGRQDKADYTPPEGLPWGTGPWYWRVDEVQANGAVTTGRTWEFSVADYLIVEDFEGYDDAEGTGTRLYETWIDGYTDGQSGSTVGNMDPPFAEQTIVHGGRQSMPMDYNNVNSPYFSQAYREFTPLADWTVQGVTDLNIWVRGNPAPLAAVTENNGKMTVAGEGTDIWNTGDQFTFVYKALNGNGSLIARVTSAGTGTNTWAKGGVMIRDDLTADSAHGTMAMTGGGGNGASFQYRLMADTDSANADAAAVLALPYYVKIERAGDTITASLSPDGTNWTPQGVAQYIAMTNPAYIGIAVTSHAAGEWRTFEFDHVQATGASGSWKTAELGLRRNSPQPVYAIIEDSAGKKATVVDPNAAAVNTTTWSEWKIPLADLAGVNLSKVKALYVGVGDPANPAADGYGRVYIDDIRLTKPAGQ